MAKCWFSRNGFFWISKKQTNFLKFKKISLKREFLYLEMDCHETDPLETVFLKRYFLKRDSLGTDSLRISRFSQKGFFPKGFFWKGFSRKGFSWNLKKDLSQSFQNKKRIIKIWIPSKRIVLFLIQSQNGFSQKRLSHNGFSWNGFSGKIFGTDFLETDSLNSIVFWLGRCILFELNIFPWPSLWR